MIKLQERSRKIKIQEDKASRKIQEDKDSGRQISTKIKV
jgi:hypothetical protein